VHFNSALKLKSWCKNAEIQLIEKGGHTFGASHPYHNIDLPEVNQVIQSSIFFLKK
jgi:hypothetical protein